MQKPKQKKPLVVNIDKEREFTYESFQIVGGKVAVQCTYCKARYQVEPKKEYPLPDNLNAEETRFEGSRPVSRKVYHCPHSCKVLDEDGNPKDATIILFQSGKDRMKRHEEETNG